MTAYAPLALVLKNQVHQLLPVFAASIETEDSNRLDKTFHFFLLSFFIFSPLPPFLPPPPSSSPSLLLPRANALARIFTEMAESLLFSIVHYPDTPLGDIKSFELLLHCAEHYEFEVRKP